LRQLIQGRKADLDGLPCSSQTSHFLDNLSPDLVEILNQISQNGGGVWIVGGAVRDWMLGHSPNDIDLAVDLTPEAMIEIFSDAILTGEDFGTVSLRGKNCLYQATTLRTDGEYLDGRRPEKVTWGMSLSDDLERRDFTINAMAIDVARKLLYDPHNGRNDISRGIIRAVGNAHQRLSEDGLRIMRAYRFADRRESGVWEIEHSLKQSISQQKNMLDSISSERIWIEWKKILSGKNSGEVIEMMALEGILDRFLVGEWSDRFSLLDAMKKNLEIFSGIERFALLLCSCTINDVKLICSNLKLSRKERDEIQAIHHMFGHIPEQSNQSMRKYRFILNDFAEKHLIFEMIILESGIKMNNKQGYSIKDLENILQTLRGLEKLNTDLEPLADGNWIMNQTGLTKGIRLGRLKSWLHTIQIERDLTSISQIERVLSTLSWKNGDVDNWPQLKFPQ
jgi:tRNA nucleotidyltransferase/poly(A) polymerase